MALIVRRSSFSEGQGQVVRVVQPSLPSPWKYYHLMVEALSWGQRISFVFQQRFRISPSQNILEKCDRLARAVCFAYSDESLDGPLVQKEMEETLTLMIEERSKPYQRFGVQSEDQLREKQVKLANIKLEALRKYFANGGMLAKQKIDEALLFGLVGEIRPEDTSVIDRYWEEAYGVDIWGAETHLKIDQAVFALYSGKILQAFDDFEESRTQENLKLYATPLKRKLFKAAERTHQLLIEKRQDAGIKSEKIRYEYSLFKGRLWAPIFIRRLLRKILSALIEDTDSAIPRLVRSSEDRTKNMIGSYLEELNSFSCCVDPQKIADRYPSDSAEKQTAILNVNQISRERIQHILQELQSKTFAAHLKEAQEMWGYRLQEMRQVLAEETSAQKTAARVFDLMENFMKAHFFHKPGEYDEDLRHDFSQGENPVEYFVRIFSDHDREVLEMLQKIPIEVVS